MNSVSLLAPPPRSLDATGRLALANALDAEICGLHRRRSEDLARITARLAALRESLGYLSLGFASVQAYAKARVGWGSSKVKSLLELHGRLPHQPLIAAAFEAGEVDWSKAVLASRAASKEPEREADWLRAAQTLSSRKLEVLACGKTGEEPRRGRWFELSAEDEATLDEGQRALRSEGLDLAPGAALAELIRRALMGGSVGSSGYRFLLVECVTCKRTTHPPQATAASGEVTVESALAERLRCDAEVHDTRQEPARVSSTIPPSVKNQILARSRGCCEFPGCTHRGHLEFHHARGRGRGHDPEWMFHFCTGHHRAPHEGAVRIEGSWSVGVRFHRADGSLIGTVGGPEGGPAGGPAGGLARASREEVSGGNAAFEAPSPVAGASRDALAADEPTASCDEGSEDRPSAALGRDLREARAEGAPAGDEAALAPQDLAGRVGRARACSATAGARTRRENPGGENDAVLALVALGLPRREATRRVEAVLSADRTRVWEAGRLAAAALRPESR